MLKQLRSFAILFGIVLAPFISYSQSPVILPPMLVSGPIKVTTANLLDVTVQGHNVSSKHQLQVIINYTGACDNLFAPASQLDIQELTLDDLGKIPQEYQISYDASWVHTNDGFNQSLLQTGFLPEGCYDVCYIFTEEPEQVIAKVCIQFTIEGSFPFYLLTPFDGATIEDPYPILSWTPYQSGELLTYQVTLAEYFSGQSPMEAILSNTPKLQEKGIDNSFLQYPITALPLDFCRTYAWKVDVLKNDEQIVKSSEIWSFSTKCDETFDPSIVNDRYHYLSDDAFNIPFNVVSDTLRFILSHPYEEIPDYRVSIKSLDSGESYDVKPNFHSSVDMEEANMAVGENYCMVDLKALGMIPGVQYVLNASNQNNTYFLHFLYHKP